MKLLIAAVSLTLSSLTKANAQSDTLSKFKCKDHIPDFRCNGYNKLFNSDNYLWMEGSFKDGKLQDGLYYVYDREGRLLWTEKFKNGLSVDKIYPTK